MKKLIINESKSIKQSLFKLERNKEKCLVAVNKKHYFSGTINDGDIRRAITKGANIESNIKKYLQKKPFFLTLEKFKKMKSNQLQKLLEIKKNFENIDIIPILNNKKQIVKIITSSLLNSQSKTTSNKLNEVPLIIMAGGKGTRLKPFTNFFPKALMPFSNVTAADFIINHFRKHGLKDIIFSINYKKNLIKSYFGTQMNIDFIEEKKPLGTVGSLSLIKDKKFEDLIAINCDSMVTANISKLFEHHKNKKNDLTLTVTSQKLTLPYGACFLDKKTQKFQSIIEKPSTNHLVNIGLYIFKKNIINLIPKNKKFDIGDLINLAKKKKKKIGVFPVSTENWIDIGNLEKY
jgi:dTDP-glucose pyrophosphorylase